MTPASLAESHEYCRRLTRQAARNFYFGLKLLPDQARRDMFALYAWMRLIDDIADDADHGSTQDRLAKLDVWQRDTHCAAAGETLDGEIWPAFTEMVRRRNVPLRVFDDAIEGQRQDLQPQPMRTFADLHEYCYRVAGTVGLASIYIWGFEGGEETEQLSISRGVALQLTNILRDLKEDADRGRVYLPEDELERAGLTLTDLQSGSPRFADFMRHQIDRAESYYENSAGLESRITPECRATLSTMTEIYHRLLAKIATDPAAVLRRRVSLSIWSKARIAWRANRGTGFQPVLMARK
jgi:phytoene synthase